MNADRLKVKLILGMKPRRNAGHGLEVGAPRRSQLRAPYLNLFENCPSNLGPAETQSPKILMP